jgi:hypothetical protein
LLASIVEYIGVRTTARQQWAQQPATATTTPLAGVHIGTRVFAVVGTSDIRRDTQRD